MATKKKAAKKKSAKKTAKKSPPAPAILISDADKANATDAVILSAEERAVEYLEKIAFSLTMKAERFNQLADAIEKHLEQPDPFEGVIQQLASINEAMEHAGQGIEALHKSVDAALFRIANK